MKGRRTVTRRIMAFLDGRGGFALISTVALMAFVFGVAIALISYVLAGRQAGKYLTESFNATQVADAGLQKALFCLKAVDGSRCGGTWGATYVGEANVDIGGGNKFTTVVTGEAKMREITSTGTTTGGRSVTLSVVATTEPPSDAPPFAYALQSGEGGAHLENSANITGTIYSNGDVTCQSTQAGVTGDAYSAKVGGKIQSCNVGADAHADNILDSVVQGDAYYYLDPSGITGTTVGGLKFPGRPTPIAYDLPAFDLEFWRGSAEYGGTIFGDYTPADNTTLGPIKITGNLHIGTNIDITVTGPIWVMGNVTTENNSSLRIDSTYGNYGTVLLADDPDDMANRGRILLSPGTTVAGTGAHVSHLLFISTNASASDTVPAISVANTASGAIFSATNGTLRLQNNAAALAIAGYRLFADQNAIVNYDVSALTGAEFANSPPDQSWRLLPGTWRQIK